MATKFSDFNSEATLSNITGLVGYIGGGTNTNVRISPSDLTSGILKIGEIVSSATEGSVLFAGAGGALSQDNSSFFWDDTNKRLGIGTSTPTTPLDIGSETGVAALTVDRATGQPNIKSSDIYLILDSNSGYLSLNHFVSDDVALARGGGNVGVGLSNPAWKFHVLNGTGNLDSKFESNAGHARVLIDSTSADDAILQFNEANARRWSIYADGTDDSFKITRSDVPTTSPTTDAIAIDSSDNVSIPNGNLEISGQAYSPTHELTDEPTISVDWDEGNVATVTLAGNRTLANPTNPKDGATYVIIVKQDGTGSRTLAYQSNYKWENGTAPTLSTGANAVDILTFVSDGTNMYGAIAQNFS